MSATEFVRSAGLTSTATVATHILPIFGACLLTSIVRARYPRYAPTERPPPIPLTFGGLFVSGLKASFARTARVATFIVGTATAAPALAEALRLGVRHTDDPEAALHAMATYPAAAVPLWYLLFTKSFDSPVRKVGGLALAAFSGILIPQVIMALGPATQRTLSQWFPSVHIESDRASREMR